MYARPVVAIAGGGATTNGTAHALGGVGAVALVNAGNGYTFPTVDFDLPDAPDGIQAQAHVICKEVACKPAKAGATVTITGVVVDDPGSGYTAAPDIVIRDGTQFDPIAHDPGTFTEATRDDHAEAPVGRGRHPGAGYTSAPTVTIGDAAATKGTGALATATTNFGDDQRVSSS